MPTSSPGNSHTHDIVAKLWNLCNVLNYSLLSTIANRNRCQVPMATHLQYQA
jgi:hypothetical protein